MAGGRKLGLAGLLLAATVLGSQPASGAVGDFSYQDCISSNSSQVSCAQFTASNTGGTNTALDSLDAMVASPDGANLYAIGDGSDSITWLSRDPTTGVLSFGGCLTASNATVGCTRITGSTADGAGSGMGTPQFVAISPDGKSVYATSIDDDALARFTRDETSGALTYEGCISSDTNLNTKCTSTPVTAAGGGNTALQALGPVVVSADGSNIYTASAQSDALTRFNRDPTTGAFNGFQSCITDDTNVASCSAVYPNSNVGGDNRGMDGLNSLAVTPDGKSIFATAIFSDAVLHFTRADSGVVDFGSCVASDAAVTGCTLTPISEVNNGIDTALDGVNTVVASADNRNVYVTTGGASSVSVFGRNATTGAFNGFEGCVTTNTATRGCTPDPGAAAGGTNTHLAGTSTVVVSQDGNEVYAGSDNGDAFTRYERRAGDGAVIFKNCSTTNTNVTGCTQIPPGIAGGASTPLNAIKAIVASPDARNVYIGSATDAIARFDIEQPPVITPPPPATPSNDFSVGGVVKNKSKGTAQLTVTVPGAGAVSLGGNGLAPKAATAPTAGDVTLKVKTTGNKRKKLKRKGKAKVTAAITFTPTGGTANTEDAKLKLVRR